MFFSGSLQEGIALAVQESKAVICFVQDDGQTSSQWQNEYFAGDEEFTRLLETRSVLLRIAKESPEAGFLASVCPVSQYPTVVVIKNGMLREYIVPDVTKDEFRSRLTTVMHDNNPQSQVAASSTAQQVSSQSQGAGDSPAQPPGPIATPPATAAASVQTSSGREQRSGSTAGSSGREEKPTEKSPSEGSQSIAVQPPQKPRQEHKPVQSFSKPNDAPSKDIKKETPAPRTSKVERPPQESPASPPAPRPGPPAQYRLQVRLFDGRSVRSTFSPSHTIRKDVRPWLDSQMEEKRPYNLKHILTPLPNQTLTIAEEDQTLREIISGSTATFVMVPIKSYIEAYSDSGSLPVRAVSSVYGMVSSIVSSTTGYIGSWLGYGQTQATQPYSEPSQPAESQSSGETPRRRPFGPNIRTLRDQLDGQDRSAFYNGNQLNFEPRRDDER
ncbi:hypothetical protein BJX63DRAFT_128861 [Aspergillus granulosus]|uniref:UBX domain-containing protein 2 n=1 Tax=Aspergillus granulosus TaxID=176169 RepID=A0ABR4HN51_9EURO